MLAEDLHPSDWYCSTSLPDFRSYEIEYFKSKLNKYNKLYLQIGSFKISPFQISIGKISILKNKYY